MYSSLIVQMGTRKEIVVTLVDEFVKDFVSSLDRCPFVKAIDIMSRAYFVADGSESVDFVAELMSKGGSDHVWVIGESGSSLGIMKHKDLQRKEGRANRAEYYAERISVSCEAGASLRELVRVAAGSRHPIPVTNSHRKLVGEITLEMLLLYLAQSI